MNAEYSWSREPDIAAWLDRAQLNTGRDLRSRSDEPQALANLAALLAQSQEG